MAKCFTSNGTQIIAEIYPVTVLGSISVEHMPLVMVIITPGLPAIRGFHTKKCRHGDPSNAIPFVYGITLSSAKAVCGTSCEVHGRSVNHF